MDRTAGTSGKSPACPKPSSRRPTTRSRILAALSCVALAAALGVAGARAGSCRVLVALGAVDVEPSPAGLSLNISGIWEFDNLIQVATGLSFNVLLVRGDTFVRLHYPDQAFYGNLAGLGARVDAGINGNDLMAIEANGIATTGARFVSLEAQRMKLTAPKPTAAGPLSVVAYLVLDGDYISPIISNTLSRSIPDAPPTAGAMPDAPLTVGVLPAAPAGASQP